MASSSINTQEPQSALLSTSAGSGLALDQGHDDSTAHSSYQSSMHDDLESPTSPTPCLLTSATSSRRNDATRQIYLNQEEEPPPTSTLTSVSYYPSNKISTSKYTLFTFIPKNLYEQFRRVANVFFLAIAILQFFPLFQSINPWVAAFPLIFIIFLTAVKDGIEDWKRNLSDKRINGEKVTALGAPWVNVNARFHEGSLAGSQCTPLSAKITLFLKNMFQARSGQKARRPDSVCSIFNNQHSTQQFSAYKWAKKTWADVLVGDVILLKENDPIPADTIILSSSNSDGSCYVETMNLDGETNLKTRSAVDITQQLTTPSQLASEPLSLHVELPNPSLHSFTGTLHRPSVTSSASLGFNHLLLRGCHLRNTDWVIGMVIYTGAETKIRLNAGKTPSKRSYNEKMMNVQVAINLFFMLAMCLCNTVVGTYIQQTWVPESPIWLQETFGGSDIQGTARLGWFIQGIIIFLLSILAYQNIVPISLYLSVEVVKTIQTYLIYEDLELYNEEKNLRCIPRSWNLADDLGQIEFVFSDKTGTLTRNIMELKLCSIGGFIYGQIQPPKQDIWANASDSDLSSSSTDYRSASPNNFALDSKFATLNRSAQDSCSVVFEFFQALILCHTVMVSPPTEEGEALTYKAQSPDELALVNAAKDVGFILKSRDAKTITIESLGTTGTFTVLQTFEFDSTRKRMSVIVQNERDEIYMYCKGAETVIYERLGTGQDELLATNMTHLERFAADGFRTLCVSFKKIDKDVYEAWAAKFHEATVSLQNREERVSSIMNEMEQDLILLGTTAIEDKLQDGVPDTIARLSKAGMKIWVLTGDKMETAINIGYTCNLLTKEMNLILVNGGEDPEDVDGTITQLRTALSRVSASPEYKYALVIDGRALFHALQDSHQLLLLQLALHCVSVICCRVSPLQKATVVQLVKDGLGAMCLAIGDGANDVSMIQSAQVGIGISGEEGMQAVMAADFAISEFRHLEKLLLVHGHWSYMRTSNMILAFFFKNITWVFPILLYQYYCGFSGNVIYDFIFMVFYNTIFTAFPVIVLGITDIDASAKTMRSIPALYSSGIRHELFTMSIFYWIVLESLYQSTIIFIVFTFAFGEASMQYNGQPPNGAEYGAMLAVTTLFNVNFFVGVMSYSLNILTIMTIALSNLSVFAATILYSAHPDSTLAGIAETDFLNPNFWAAFLLSFVACHLPRLTIRFIMTLSDPSDMDIILEQQKFGIRKEYLETKKSMAHFDEPKRVSVNMSTIRSQLELIKSGSSTSLNSRVSWLDAGIDPTDLSPKQTELNILTSDEMRAFNRRTVSLYRRSS